MPERARRHKAIQPDRAIRVAIIEDQREIREGLALLINAASGFSCDQRFPSMEKALAGLENDVPDVALVDLGLPGMSGIEGIQRLKQKHPSLHLLVLTVFDDDHRIFESLCAGASGYLLKKTPPVRLLECIKEVVDGGAAMSPSVAKRVVTFFLHVHPATQPECELTPQELRVLRLLVEGYQYKSAAEALGVGVSTVSTHVKHIYEKLRVHSKSEAVTKAIRKRLVV